MSKSLGWRRVVLAVAASRELAATIREVAIITWRTSPFLTVTYVVAMVLEALAPVVSAWLIKLIVDGLASGSSSSQLVRLAVALVGASVVMAGLPHVSGYVSNEVGRRFTVSSTDRLFAAVSRLPGLRPFEDPSFLDRIRLAQQGVSGGGRIATEVFATGRGVLTVCGFAASLLVISPLLTVVAMAAAAPALVARLQLSRWRARMTRKVSPVDRWQAMYGNLLSRVDAAKEVRLFGSGAFLRSRMMAHLREATDVRRRMDRRVLSTEVVLAVIGAALTGFGILWGIRAAISGRLTPGDITMLMSAFAAVQQSLTSMSLSVASVYHGLILFGYFVTVTRMQPDLPVLAQPTIAGRLSQGIELRNVWFRYSAEHPWILKGVNLFIAEGSSVGLVGSNGSGKSTLVKLLCRFYDPDEGQILWDGVDLRKLRPEDVRERISAVFQDSVAYDMSAKDNILVGDVSEQLEMNSVRRAADRAGMDGVLSAMPWGYETLLTRMFFSESDKEDPATGVVLSGGQWQRLALARAFYREGRDLMILDEPSDGLDPEAEARIHAETRRYRAGHTSILISHRLNTVRDADHLVVLEDGAIVEQGSHDDLIQTGGVYARMFHIQASGYDLGRTLNGNRATV